MDPIACIERAERAFRAHEYQDTVDALTDLAQWRAGGGFWPDGLDARFSCIFDAVMSDEVFDAWGQERLSASEDDEDEEEVDEVFDALLAELEEAGEALNRADEACGEARAAWAAASTELDQARLAFEAAKQKVKDYP